MMISGILGTLNNDIFLKLWTVATSECSTVPVCLYVCGCVGMYVSACAYICVCKSVWVGVAVADALLG